MKKALIFIKTYKGLTFITITLITLSFILLTVFLLKQTQTQNSRIDTLNKNLFDIASYNRPSLKDHTGSQFKEDFYLAQLNNSTSLIITMITIIAVLAGFLSLKLFKNEFKIVEDNYLKASNKLEDANKKINKLDTEIDELKKEIAHIIETTRNNSYNIFQVELSRIYRDFNYNHQNQNIASTTYSLLHISNHIEENYLASKEWNENKNIERFINDLSTKILMTSRLLIDKKVMMNEFNIETTKQALKELEQLYLKMPYINNDKTQKSFNILKNKFAPFEIIN